ncbi:MAG: hypothetical protein RBR28_06920 [Lentimicrobium sp.]|jgi:opacity protein-like surface antigen|nr:hypothetical protein [Lentimicrobium sp.]
MPKILLSLLLVSLAFSGLKAQPTNFGYWQFGGGVTVQSFFGDLSVHDFDPAKKIKEESAPGFYLQLTRHFSPLFSAKMQFIHGRMKGSNPESGFRFETKFNELALIPRINLSHLISQGSSPRINAYVVAGVGIISFRARKFNMENGTLEASVGYGEQGEKSGNAQNSFVFPVGFEVTYDINNNWGLEAGYSMRLHNTDNIDAHTGSTNINDRYSVLHLGVTYAINKSQKNGIRQLDCPEGAEISRVKKRGRLF